jgi:hypothetical protein
MVGATEIAALAIAGLLFAATVACFAVFMLDAAEGPRADEAGPDGRASRRGGSNAVRSMP